MPTALLLILILLSILGPTLFSEGGIMLVDFVLSDIPLYGWDRPIGLMVIQSFGSIFGYALGSKIVIVAILLAAAVLGILFARYFANLLHITTKNKVYLLELLGMIFFLTNPFSYERMMTQPVIYGGIIALGYGIYFQLFRERYIAAGFSYAMSLALFPHASYMILCIIILSAIFFRMRMKKGVYIRLLLPIILLNLNWIGVTLIYNPLFSEKISEFTIDNFQAFATQSIEPLNVFFTTLLLYGFWGEKYDNHFAHVSLMSPYWYIAGFIILLSLFFGGYVLKEMKKIKEVKLLLFLSGISLLFAIGSANEFTEIIRKILSNLLPYWDGYREPEKWTGVLVVTEGILFLAAVSGIFRFSPKKPLPNISITLLIAMLLYIWSPGVYISYRNQMRTTVYPPEFFHAREVLENEYGVKKVLLLPWYSYIGCGWISRPSIANPSVPFFRNFPLVVSERVDVGRILEKNEFLLSESKNVEKFLESYEIEYLKKAGISHILFMKYCYGSEEIEEYLDVLTELGDIKKISKDESIDLYIIP